MPVLQFKHGPEHLVEMPTLLATKFVALKTVTTPGHELYHSDLYARLSALGR